MGSKAENLESFNKETRIKMSSAFLGVNKITGFGIIYYIQDKLPGEGFTAEVKHKKYCTDLLYNKYCTVL
jgi:hypothetical protein